jgi:hypothetical protein
MMSQTPPRSDMSAEALAAFQREPEPDLFLAIYDLLKRTFQQVRKPDGTPYNPTRSYGSLYRNGARESINRAVLRPNTEGYGFVIDAGRFDLSYEWFVLNPQWEFSSTVKQQAWERLNVILRH